MQFTLGISGVGHDLTFSLIDGQGKVVFVGEEERFSRVKHMIGAVPSCGALTWLLHHLDIQPRQFTRVAFGMDPQLLESPAEERIFRARVHHFLKEWGLQDLPVVHYAHHLAHAASAYYPSPFDEAVIVSVDGRGEQATTALYTGTGTNIRPVWEQRDHSIGLLYLAVTTWLGLGSLGNEGKTMGLAPYGKPRFMNLFRRTLIDWDPEDGSFAIADAVLHGGYFVTSLESVLGPARLEEQPLHGYHQDVAATIQAITEEIVMGLCRRARRETGLRNLCLTGGVALNSVANGKIVESNLFERCFIPPWVADCGTAVGAGLLAHYERKPGSRRVQGWSAPSAYLGAEFSEAEILRALGRYGLPVQPVADPAEYAAGEIAAGKVVGWCQGRAEVGPRALGNRSILANPFQPDMADVVNRKVKFREPWRPFAPSVLEEDMGQYFEWTGPVPYMITVHRFRTEVRGLFPSVVHVDVTGRVQTVTESSNPLYYRLLKHFKAVTGHGMLLNTSFNINGEPIVNTPEQAIRAFLSTDLDVLVMGSYVLQKSESVTRRLAPYNTQAEQLDQLPGLPGGNALVIIGAEYIREYPHAASRNRLRKAIRNLESVVGRFAVITDVDPQQVSELIGKPGKLEGVVTADRLPEAAGVTAALLLADHGWFYRTMPEGIGLLSRITERLEVPGYVMVSNLAVQRQRDFKPLLDLCRQAEGET